MIYHGNCLDTLRTMSDNSVDAIVTDPPYGISFMGKRWDYDVPSTEIWEECLRVLKPGGHLLAFAGTRTQHRMAVKIEDAGFEIRDMLAWVYGSGFPKSLDVGKAIDKAAGAEREVVGERNSYRDNSVRTPFTYKGIGGEGKSGLANKKSGGMTSVTAPATEAAKQWDGWGTSLKPSLEPITLARKPTDGTIAQNVLKWGVGGINVDGCRVGTETMTSGGSLLDIRSNNYNTDTGKERLSTPVIEKEGRFPANFIHDGSPEVLGLFPHTTSGKMKQHITGGEFNVYGKQYPRDVETIGDSGSAARFFYCAKASKSERGAFNDHPTVKPVSLMRYLCRLITPPNGIILDPFMGSGSTLVAALEEGFNPVGIELSEDYIKIAKRRIANIQKRLL